MINPSTDTLAKGRRAKKVRDIAKFRGIPKCPGSPFTDEELDAMRFEYLSKKHGPFPPPGPLDLSHLKSFRSKQRSQDET